MIPNHRSLPPAPGHTTLLRTIIRVQPQASGAVAITDTSGALTNNSAPSPLLTPARKTQP